MNFSPHLQKGIKLPLRVHLLKTKSVFLSDLINTQKGSGFYISVNTFSSLEGIVPPFTGYREIVSFTHRSRSRIACPIVRQTYFTLFCGMVQNDEFRLRLPRLLSITGHQKTDGLKSKHTGYIHSVKIDTYHPYKPIVPKGASCPL